MQIVSSAYDSAKETHSSQSTAMIRVTSSAGRPTTSSTITMVTRPAWGIPAAPMAAAVAVILVGEIWQWYSGGKDCILLYIMNFIVSLEAG